MTNEREIVVALHDGSEVRMNTEDRVIFQASKPGAIPLSVDADSVFDDVLITLAEKDAAIKQLEEALEQPKFNLLTSLHNAQFNASEWRAKANRLRRALEDIQEECTDNTSPMVQRINKIIITTLEGPAANVGTECY